MSIILSKPLLALVLYILAGIPIDTHKDLHQSTHQVHVQRVMRDRIGPAAAQAAVAATVQDMRLRTYLYNFEGRTMFNGQPCAGSKVILRLTTSRVSEIREAITGEDGSYQISFTIQGSRHEPVDFSMDAYTPDMRRAEFSSRRIVMREDENTITVHKTLDLVNPGA